MCKEHVAGVEVLRGLKCLGFSYSAKNEADCESSMSLFYLCSVL